MKTRMTLLNNESDIVNGERYNKKITDVVDELKTNQKQEYERVTGTENETANENLVTKTNKIPSNKVGKKQILGINSLLFGLGATLLVFGVGYLAIKQKWVE